MARHAGLILPLFSVPSTTSWGIGELSDLDPLSVWMADAGFDRLMLLPLGTMVPGGTSPYSALSAMAIDPIYIAPEQVEDYARAGGDRALSHEALRARHAARARSRIDYGLVRRAKDEALDLSFSSFLRDEWQESTPRAAKLAGYLARERWWLDDYALFQALARAHGTTAWMSWAAPLRDRESKALDEARRQLAREVLRHQYLQWTAETQWRQARTRAAARHLKVVGDVPFAVATDSADVWVRAHEFMLDVSAGVPPDAFSETGQDWALPTYRWDVIAAKGFEWIRQRTRRMAALYDSVRVDHLVGLYRTYGRLPGQTDGFFIPADEPTQIWQGEQILRIVMDSGIEVLAEDLGTVPDFVRASMARLGVPGSKVLRWERQYKVPGEPFVDPASFPALSVALTGTHDTETLAAWWDGATLDERAAFLRLLAPRLTELVADLSWSDSLRDEVIALAYRAGSDHLFLPVQDLFGWRDRVNTPATVDDVNWTWRLPWATDQLAGAQPALERAAFCERLARETGRGPLPASGLTDYT